MFYSYFSFFSPIIFVFSVLSLVFGLLGGLLQKKIKKLIAYSSVTSIGFLLLNLYSDSIEATISSFLYLITYVFTLLGVFVLLSGLLVNKKKFISFDVELANFFNINKNLAFCFSILFFSLGGIPPFYGFIGKFEILNSLILKEYYLLFFFF